jgi:hypothetical protein
MDELIVAQLVNKLPVFYETRNLITCSQKMAFRSPVL